MGKSVNKSFVIPSYIDTYVKKCAEGLGIGSSEYIRSLIMKDYISKMTKEELEDVQILQAFAQIDSKQIDEIARSIKAKWDRTKDSTSSDTVSARPDNVIYNMISDMLSNKPKSTDDGTESSEAPKPEPITADNNEDIIADSEEPSPMKEEPVEENAKTDDMESTLDNIVSRKSHAHRKTISIDTKKDSTSNSTSDNGLPNTMI